MNSTICSIKKRFDINRYSFIIALFFCLSISYSQSSIEVKNYFNRTNTAIYSLQKQLMNNPTSNLKEDFSDALLMQLNALKLYESSDLKLSLTFSSLSRNKCIALFSKLNLSNYNFLYETSEEKKLTSSLVFTNDQKNQINQDLIKMALDVDTKNPTAIYTLIPNLK